MVPIVELLYEKLTINAGNSGRMRSFDQEKSGGSC